MKLMTFIVNYCTFMICDKLLSGPLYKSLYYVSACLMLQKPIETAATAGYSFNKCSKVLEGWYLNQCVPIFVNILYLEVLKIA